MQSNRYCEVFNQSAKMLVLMNLMRQDEIRPQFPNMGPKGWAKEFCTIRLAAGRRSGSTTTALDLAESIFEHPVLVVMNKSQQEAMQKELENRRQEQKITIDKKFNIRTIGEGLVGYNGEWDGDKPLCDGVIVDCCSVIERTSKNLDYVYESFSFIALQKNFCFVLLG
jgi:hypothetical protein